MEVIVIFVAIIVNTNLPSQGTCTTTSVGEYALGGYDNRDVENRLFNLNVPYYHVGPSYLYIYVHRFYEYVYIYIDDMITHIYIYIHIHIYI